MNTFDEQIQAAAEEYVSRPVEYRFDAQPTSITIESRIAFQAGSRATLELLARAEEGQGRRGFVSRRDDGGLTHIILWERFADTSAEFCEISELLSERAKRLEAEAAVAGWRNQCLEADADFEESDHALSAECSKVE